jgi:hypothetical protein
VVGWVRTAERYLASLDSKPGFALLLLRIMQQSRNEVAQCAAAIAFKNHIRTYWRKVEGL